MGLLQSKSYIKEAVSVINTQYKSDNKIKTIESFNNMNYK